ncbi:AraC family transcriptional regulator [Ruminococcus sp.]|uniref:AraC family transcriptional regulator n=1 Tax=Ruminococcus sp. TaxID=41978 RepID=UPI00388E870B
MAANYKGKYEIVTADDNLPGKVMLYEKPGRDCFTHKHWHKNLEIDYIIRGCMWTNLGGEDKDLYGGDYLLINSEAVHQTCGKNPDEPVKYLVVLFSYNYIKSYFPDFDDYRIDVDKNEQTRARVRDLLKAIVFEAENPSEFSKLKIACAMSQILMNLFTKCRVPREVDPDAPRVENGSDYIAKAIGYIRDNYRDRITLEDISSFVGLTPTYFSRHFSASTQKTFKTYLNLVRLENALIDIQQNGMSETRASLENGFPSVKSFITVFKSVYGCPPSEYVKVYQEEAPISEIHKV